jgi:hypothetical protein
MKWCAIILLCCLCCDALSQQELPQRQEQQLENLAEREENDVEDDSFVQELEAFRKRPLNLNTATADDLERLQLLNALQVHALLQYRLLLGAFLHLYELQAVPHWDVATIQKVLPYVSVNDETTVARLMSKGLRDGNGTLMLRLSQSLPNAAEYDDTTATGYRGSPQKILVRYRYNYKNVLQWGVLADKDAGEPLFKDKQRAGFDFYSLHLFVRNVGIIHSLAVGDFAVNMGQGLIQWQSLGFRKSTEITAIKRQSPVLRPYTSAGEYNFHRGVGITLRKKRMFLTVFASLRHLDANTDAGTAGNLTITSFINAGMHRSQKEMEKKNNIRQLAGGFNLLYKGAAWHVGTSCISYEFSNPIQKRDEPYNYYAFSGRRLTNYSVDYDYTVKNMHLFGELAFSPGANQNKALLQGMLISLDPKADASLVFRHLESGFQSLYSTAFTENSLPANESGLFIGLSLKPVRGIRLDMYADVFSFPWLKLRADRPGGGREFLVQLAYEPNKRVEVISRFRYEAKQANDMIEDDNRLYILRQIPKINWRLHVSWQATTTIRLRQRMELVWFDKGMPEAEAGYLIYNDVAWHPVNKPFDFSGRLELFETDGFNSRIYAFENDVPGSYSISAVYQKGLRYYVNSKIDVSTVARKNFSWRLPLISLFLRWGYTIQKPQYPIVYQSVRQYEYKAQLIFLGF